MHEWQEEVLYQCKNSATFKELSAIKSGSPCLLLIACRHHKYPLPYDFFINLGTDVDKILNSTPFS